VAEPAAGRADPDGSGIPRPTAMGVAHHSHYLVWLTGPEPPSFIFIFPCLSENISQNIEYALSYV